MERSSRGEAMAVPSANDGGRALTGAPQQGGSVSGQRRRQERRQQRREAGGGTPAAAPPRAAGSGRAPRQRSAWRQKVDSFGGLTVVGIITAAVVFVGFLVWNNRPVSVSDDPLMGEERQDYGTEHVTDPAAMIIPPDEPPVSGPHFPQWLPEGGSYDDPVPDGNALHNLEHGMIWISYRPDLLTEEQIQTLREFGEDRSDDVIVSPRPQNAAPITVASWLRILTLDEPDTALFEQFVDTNRNRSPEPGVR